jgi:hypothetical protein
MSSAARTRGDEAAEVSAPGPVQLRGIAAIVAAVSSTLAALAILIADVARAEPGPAWTWRAPDGCPDEATTRAELRAATTTACDLAADADLQPTAAGWRLDLELRTRRAIQLRTLTAGTCRALADAALVIVTVACTEDAVTLTTRGPVASSPVEAPPPPVDRPRPASPREPPAPPRPRPSRPVGELGLRGGLALSPTLAPAADLGPVLRLRWRRVDLVLAAGYTSVRRSFAADAPELGVALRLARFALAACPAREWGRGRARGRGAVCLGAELGAMLGTGLGAPDTFTRARPWAALALAPALGWHPHPRLAVVLQVDLLAAVVRPAFGLEGQDLQVRAAPFGVRVHTALLVRVF